MQRVIRSSIDEIDAQAWNALTGSSDPFLQHAFLTALEHNNCVGDRFGWLPHHIALYNDQQRLVAATPLYLKDNSYGEFVFDWSWADAWKRAGHDYYPKLVSSIPYTPATGARLLTGDATNRNELCNHLIDHTVELATSLEISSLHLLFPTENETSQLEEKGLLKRIGCQFHWNNHNFSDFDDFLQRFSASKRKKLRRERRQVVEAGFEFQVLHGDEISDDLWPQIHHFYASTFHEKGGIPTLNEAFFREVGGGLGRKMVVILAIRSSKIIAGAICFRSDDTLYGRHWGTLENHHSLHFETCLYQGIDYCIQHGLKRFEPGAQGEHKVARGFEPTETLSAHWIADPQFREMIDRYLQQERAMMGEYIDDMRDRLPFKQHSGN